MLMPCFEPDQAAAEGIILGRLLAGYGEVEVTVLNCAVAVFTEIDRPVRKLFKKMSAENRIKEARRLLLDYFDKANLGDTFVEALSDMDWCRQIRNQYAHCQWYWTADEGLCYVDLEALALHPSLISSVLAGRRCISIPTLCEQENYFNYVKETFAHLESAYRAWDQSRSKPRRPIHVFSKPPKLARPRLHS